ncbi:MAG: AmmeMemoRadiSam system protein A [Nanoarchaeota archaeon]|nr:AmmeMemoRadiSam system protein A [Nanoarchaeota archaeon]
MRKPTLKQARQLVKLARAVIENGVLVETSFKEDAGVFVTLEKKGELRGCVGIIQSSNVNDLIIRTARSAAFEDSRFPPVQETEFGEIIVEISLLSKPVKCDLSIINCGDGVILKQGLNHALFLPQVWKQLPDKNDFLNQLALKAGLTSYEHAVFEKFSVISFKEEKPYGDVFFES